MPSSTGAGTGTGAAAIDANAPPPTASASVAGTTAADADGTNQRSGASVKNAKAGKKRRRDGTSKAIERKPWFLPLGEHNATAFAEITAFYGMEDGGGMDLSKVRGVGRHSLNRVTARRAPSRPPRACNITPHHRITVLMQVTVAAYHKEKRSVSLVTEGLKCLQQHRDMHVVSAGMPLVHRMEAATTHWWPQEQPWRPCHEGSAVLGEGAATRRRLLLSEAVWAALLRNRTVELGDLVNYAAQKPPEVQGLETCHSRTSGAKEAPEFGGVLVSQTEQRVWLAGLISEKGLMLLATGDVLVRFGESVASGGLTRAADDE